MPSLKYHPLVRRIRGKSGEYVYKQVRGHDYLARVPDRVKRPPTPAEAAQRERFTKAIRYSQAVLADPVARVPYDELAKKSRKQPHNLMVRDYFMPPQIESVELGDYSGAIGDRIVIKVLDDFEVASISLKILDASDVVLESGTPVVVTGEPGQWSYTATTGGHDAMTVKVIVTAIDRPGNKTTKISTKS